MARGLDYYTGLIYEAVLNDANGIYYMPDSKEKEETSGIGSIAAGGRYDELVGMFSGGKKIPCVGISIGVERVFSILLKKAKLSQVRSTKTQVFVISIGELITERMEILKELWDSGIAAEMIFKNKPKLPSQWHACEKEGIPFAVIIGSTEVEKGVIKIKDMSNKTGTQDEKEQIVPRSSMISELKARLKMKE